MISDKNITEYPVMRNLLKKHDFAYEFFLFISVSSGIIILISLMVYHDVNSLIISITGVSLFCLLIYFIVKSFRLNKQDKDETAEQPIRNDQSREPSRSIKIDPEEFPEFKKKSSDHDALLKVFNYELNATDFLSYMAHILEGVQGLFYQAHEDRYSLLATFAYYESTGNCEVLPKDDGFIGAAGSCKKLMIIDNVPSGYFRAFSGLGNSDPLYLVFVPVIINGSIFGIIEMATFKYPTEVKIEAMNYLVNNGIERIDELPENKMRKAV